jgi:hypothetical protein
MHVGQLCLAAWPQPAPHNGTAASAEAAAGVTEEAPAGAAAAGVADAGVAADMLAGL